MATMLGSETVTVPSLGVNAAQTFCLLCSSASDNDSPPHVCGFLFLFRFVLFFHFFCVPVCNYPRSLQLPLHLHMIQI